jgi:hypothetical protein
MQTALFLGAGASAAFGYPVTNELLPRIIAGARRETLFGYGKRDRRECKLLLSSLEALFPGIARDVPPPSITDVLSLLDHSIAASSTPLRAGGLAELQTVRRLLERGIFEVFPPEERADKGDALDRLCRWVADVARSPDDDIGIISTNYDLVVETELFERLRVDEVEAGTDFGFNWRDPEKNRVHRRPEDPVLRLYKLHGSLNTLRCDQCEHLYLNRSGRIGHQAFRARTDEWNTCHCEHSRLRLGLVTPSLVRDIREPNLLEVWKSALELLRTAREWVIVGYSLPVEDVAIRSILLRAHSARRRPPRVRVVQLGKDEATIQRYAALFPEARYFDDGLERFLKERASGVARGSPIVDLLATRRRDPARGPG